MPTFSQVMADPSASHWLKAQMTRIGDRDPVDLANDAAFLADWLTATLTDPSLRR